jgi:hypothetical protein
MTGLWRNTKYMKMDLKTMRIGGKPLLDPLIVAPSTPSRPSPLAP